MMIGSTVAAPALFLFVLQLKSTIRNAEAANVLEM
jgi:hypothetical protein